MIPGDFSAAASGPAATGEATESSTPLSQREIARRLQAMREELLTLLEQAPSPALEMLFWHIQEYLFVAQEYADPATVSELTPYDRLLHPSSPSESEADSGLPRASGAGTAGP